MKSVRFEDAVRRGAGRLQGSVSHLIDDSQSVVGAKLAEAGDLIQGAFAHLLEESQDLIHAKMIEASDGLQHTREQAARGARVVFDHARDRAEDSYGQWHKLARRRPLTTALIAVGLGVAVGLMMRRRKATAEAQTATVKPASAKAQVARRTPAARKTNTTRKPPQTEPPNIAH
jgi:hypothetical protein